MKLVEHDAPFNVHEGPHLIVEGVHGYAIQDGPGALWLPVIMGIPAGAGHVGRFLETLPRDRAIIVPTVVSKQLKDMLHRRGFMDAMVLPPSAPVPSNEGTRATRCGPWSRTLAFKVLQAGSQPHPYEIREGWWTDGSL
jgi:hypothetical protein